MSSRLAPVVAALTLAGTAQADPRITSRFYEPATVVTVHGRTGIETTIAFADDEHIENVAVGDSAAWQVTPNKRANLLFLKPATGRAHTNMTVITDQRTYLFDLVSAQATPVYMLRFTYPAAPKPAQVAVAPPPPTPEPAPMVAATLPADMLPPPPAASPADLNFAWASDGDRKLLPARTFDDGHSTFLSWPKDATLPAILTRGPTGQEGPVNFTVKGDYIVVDGVPAQLVLRAGKQMATLTPQPRPQPSAIESAPATAAITQTASARP